MLSWCRQLFDCCSGFGHSNLRNEPDWGSTPSVTSSAPSTRRSSESAEVPFDPFRLDGHRHLGYLDCHRIERQLCHRYSNVQRDPELLPLLHRPRATLVRPSDLVQALTAWGYHVTAVPSPARRRALRKCNHQEIDAVPSLVPDEYQCIACIDQQAAADSLFREAHRRFIPLGVSPVGESDSVGLKEQSYS